MKNIAVVRALIDHQMPINKQSIQLLLRQSYRFNEADLNTLALMNRHHIPVTEESITQLESYQNGEHPILHKIADMAQEIPALLADLTSENSGEALRLFGKELLSILPQQAEVSGKPVSPGTDILLPEEREALIELFPEDVLSEDAKETILNGSASAKVLLSLLPEEALSQPAAASLSEKLGDYQQEMGQLLTLFTPEELSSFTEETYDFPLPLPLKELIASGEASASETVAGFRDVLPHLSSGQVARLFHSPVFQKLLQQNILSGWTLKLKDLTQEGAVKDLYETIQKELSSLEKLMNGALPDSEAAASISSKAQNVQQNIDFMNLLNQFYPYVQLPLHLKEQITHGDLFVFTKKKELIKKNDAISVLLHLDMEHLGSLDIHLALNKNEVSSSFFVE